MVMEDIPEAEKYHNAVNTIADEIEESCEVEDVAYPSEYVHEFVDGSEWTHKTDKALTTLQTSQNGPQEWKHLVADGDSWQEVITAMAYDAMRNDVSEELQDRGVL